MAKKENSYGARQQLLVYRFIARRFRPAAVLMVFAGLIAQLPWFIVQLRWKNAIIPYDLLAYMGVLLIFVGAILWIISIFRVTRAWVQCQPDFLVINTAGRRTHVAYQRIIELKPVRVRDIFKLDETPGNQRRFIKPLISETALEVEVNDWPLPEKQLRRRMSRFLLSTRDTGFVFIVKNPTQLSTDIDSALQRTRDVRAAEQQRYLDPIERMRYQS